VAIAAGTAVPLADLFGEWQSALATWALVAILTVVAWHGTVVRRSTAATASFRAKTAPRQKFSYRSVTAWLVTFYAATPMVIGFTIVAWISPFYLSAGLPDQSAANRLVTFQIAQLLSMILLPLLAERLRDLRILLAAPLVLACGGVGLLLADPRFLDPLAVIMLGLGVGGTTALGLFLIPVISTSVGVAGQLSGMVFTVAFTASAVGPVTLGALRDLTDSYTIGFVALLTLGLLALGSVLALRPGRVVDPVGQPPGQV
jgi:CP family cyanate transporter-like MFS transporter